jgi:pyridoxamine 5'-phosphate oxidase
MADLSNYRKKYEKSELIEASIPNNPIDLFDLWFKDAERTATIEEVNAMTIATIGLDGFPKSRVVLLKKYDIEGFTFFTNYNSEKGKSIDNNSNVCLSFFWYALERQVIIKGRITKTSAKISDDYFVSRPKGSQLGAIVSDQSEVINSRDILEHKLNELELLYQDKAIKRPIHWGGYIVTPIEIEFWQGRPNRLHDRIRFQLTEDKSWKIERLAP